jgi:hypothetical protein
MMESACVSDWPAPARPFDFQPARVGIADIGNLLYHYHLRTEHHSPASPCRARSARLYCWPTTNLVEDRVGAPRLMCIRHCASDRNGIHPVTASPQMSGIRQDAILRALAMTLPIRPRSTLRINWGSARSTESLRFLRSLPKRGRIPGQASSSGVQQTRPGCPSCRYRARP